MPTIAELRHERGRLIKEAQDLLRESPGNRLAKEVQERFDGLMTEADEVKGRIEREERAKSELAELEERANEPTSRPQVENRDDKSDKSEGEYRKAFESYVRFGLASMPAEERSLVEKRFHQVDTRALGVSTPTAGGYTVPQDFYNRLIDAQKAYGGFRKTRATVITSDNGQALPIPTDNDTANIGAIVSENTILGEQDVTFGQKMLGAYLYTSKIVRVSRQMLQDSAFDIESWLSGKLGVRIGRALANDLVNGTGANAPSGLLAPGSAGAPVGWTSTTTGIGGGFVYNDLVELEHSIDPAYREMGEFMMHDTALKTAKELKDNYGHPLWLPGLADKAVDTILGHPYVINQAMPAVALNATSIAFGDFSNYFIRDVKDVTVIRLEERYAEYMQVAFVAFSRHDGVLVDAGTGPIKLFKGAAS